jgi:hypothetical protein
MLVDDEDYELMSRIKWHAIVDNNGCLSVQARISAHNFLTGYALTDHANGNPLDNTRGNLRDATSRQNSWNRRLRSDSRTGYKGVNSRRGGRGYVARILVDGKRKTLGWFHDPINAAKAYDAAAREAFGEFARLNFPDSEDLPDARESRVSRTQRRVRETISGMEDQPSGKQSKYSEASWNRPYRGGTRAGFKGVNWSGRRWQARIMKDGKRHFLGTYDTAEEAARAYDAAACTLFGGHARLNFPGEAA